MAWLESVVDWISEQGPLAWWLFAGSLAMLVLSPLMIGVVVPRLPQDYFADPHAERKDSRNGTSGLRAALRLGRNLLGLVLLLAGVAMLFVPGQGVLTIAVALLLLDFPGKRRVLRWLATRKPVWRSLNWLRRRAGKEPFTRPE